MYNKLSPNIKILFLFMLVVILLFLRTPDIFITPQFWAEDGHIFFESAKNGEFSSIITPYAGYLIIFPRIWAFFANLFNIAYTPTLYLLFSIGCAVFLCYTILRAFHSYSFIQKIFLCASIALIPRSEEIFNNLTNAHWYLGCALLLTLLWTTQLSKIKRFIDYLIIFSLGLTGPFSIIYLPIVLIRAYLLKDMRYSLGYYISWIVPALIQAIVYLNSERLHQLSRLSNFNGSIYDFIKPYFSSIVLLSIAISWCFLLIYRKRTAYNTYKDEKKYLTLIILLTGSITVMVVTILAVGPVVDRYTYIPYYLLITAIVIIPITKQKIILTILLLLSIQLVSFKKSYFGDLHWKSYVALSHSLPSNTILIVPIHPRGSWDIKLSTRETQKTHTINFLTPSQQLRVYPLNMDTHIKNGKLLFKATGTEPAILYNIDDQKCLKSQHIALEVKATVSQPSNTRVDWSTNGVFDLKNSIQHFSSTESSLFFAFNNPKKDTLKIRYVLETDTIGKIERLILHCISK